MRVAYVVSSSDFGGAEAYVASLARALGPQGAVVLGVGGLEPRLASRLAADAIPTVALPAIRSKAGAGGMLALRRALRACGVDLVHVNCASAVNNRHALAVAATTGRPVVVTLHIDDPLGGRLQTVALRAAYRRVAAAIAVSSGVARLLVSGLGVDPGRVHVVANGVAPFEQVSPRGGPVPVVGGHGRLTRQKGFDVLIEAVSLLRARGVAVAAGIAGEGPERPALERAAAGLPVELTGFCEPRAFLATLDVFCLPSRWEGLPLSLLEAMSAGLPVVASDVGDVAAAVGDAGVVVPPGDARALADALEELVADPGRRRALGAAARARALARYSIEAMVAATHRVYAAALSSAPARS